MDNIQLAGPEMKPKSGQKAKNVIIMLHGYGADGNDLLGLAPMLAQDFPDTHFISPHAPFPCEMSPFGRQWFSLREWSPKAMLKGAQDAAPALNMFINTTLTRLGLTDNRLALLGFSQGTMMALYAALRRPVACAGIVGFSGSLIGEEGIISKPPVCLIHGDQDNVVPHGAMALAEAMLKHEGISVESHTVKELGHGIDPQGLSIATAFLKAKLQ